MLVWSGGLTTAILGLSSIAMQNADLAGETADVSGAIGLILCFSIPIALVGFGLRMLALYLNPASRAADLAAIGQRVAREDARRLARARRAKHTKAVA